MCHWWTFLEIKWLAVLPQCDADARQAVFCIYTGPCVVARTKLLENPSSSEQDGGSMQRLVRGRVSLL